MATKPLPNRNILRQLLRYEPATGKVFWKPRSRDLFPSERAFKAWNARYAEAEALTSDHPSGYKEGSVFGVSYLAHRLIYKFVFDEEPQFIDHINGNRSDNRIENLRSVTRIANSQNTRRASNNSSQVTGVSRRKLGGWCAHIGIDNRRIALGEFGTKTEAIAARKGAEKALGFHPNHGSDSRPFYPPRKAS